MVRWRGRAASQNVEDRRGRTAAGYGGLAVLVARLVMSRWGIGGLLVLVAAFVALQLVGVRPFALLGGAPSPAPASPHEQQAFDFSSVILAETERAWTDIFADQGARYDPPVMTIYTAGTPTGCGYGSAAAGPFYCPLDRKIYLDVRFFDELAERFRAPGDFGAAYVIAHEVGHHVQTLSGVADAVRRAQAQAGEADRNRLQVMMELQADCYAGLWANRAHRASGLLEAGDIEEGLSAASAIGDDTLQKNAGRRVTPESFTHGSSAQRRRWFMTGFESGELQSCDTFSAARL
jgi:hypothetical protein